MEERRIRCDYRRPDFLGSAAVIGFWSLALCVLSLYILVTKEEREAIDFFCAAALFCAGLAGAYVGVLAVLIYRNETISISEGRLVWIDAWNRKRMDMPLSEVDFASFSLVGSHKRKIPAFLCKVNTSHGLLKWTSRIGNFEKLCMIMQGLEPDSMPR